MAAWRRFLEMYGSKTSTNLPPSVHSLNGRGVKKSSSEELALSTTDEIWHLSVNREG